MQFDSAASQANAVAELPGTFFGQWTVDVVPIDEITPGKDPRKAKTKEPRR